MNDFPDFFHDIAWPLVLLLAWLAGEWGYRAMHLPRISAYALIGFASGAAQGGLLPPVDSGALLLLANIGFGLILFESGHRLNLRWLTANPWLAATSLFESGLTFAAVYGLASLFGLPTTDALLLAALAMATSPATVLCVINEQRSAGQVSERALHLSVFSSILAVLVFKIVLALMVFKTSGSIGEATYHSVLVLLISIGLGAAFGVVLPLLLRTVRQARLNQTLIFALAVILLVALTHSLKQSPVLATLTFGVMARHRRVVLGQSQRGFGVLGQILSLFLFVFVAASLEWHKVWAGLGLGCAIIVLRALCKLAGVGLFAWLSGISWRKGFLTGMALTPISVFVILVLEQVKHLGLPLALQLAPLAAMVLVLELLGPFFTRKALILAQEVPQPEEN